MISSYRRLVLLHHYNKFEFVNKAYGKSDNLDLTMCEMLCNAMLSNFHALKFIKAIKKLRKDQKSHIDRWRQNVCILSEKWQLLMIIEPVTGSLIWLETVCGDIILCKFNHLNDIRIIHKAGRSFESLTVSNSIIHPNINLKWQYFC